MRILKNKGVSLIVLVITIIVMIILATVIIISISNNNVVEKSNTAVEQSNLKTLQESANLALSEIILANNNGVLNITDQDIKDKMLEDGVSTELIQKYNIIYNTTTGRVDVSQVSSTPDTPPSSGTILTSIALGDTWTNVTLNMPLQNIVVPDIGEDNIEITVREANDAIWTIEYEVINGIALMELYKINGNDSEDEAYYGYYATETINYNDGKDDFIYPEGWSGTDEGLDPTSISISGTVIVDEAEFDSRATQIASWFKTN